MSQFATEALKLLTQEPECQNSAGGTARIICAPGCEHEKVMALKAQAYALLDIGDHLDPAVHSLNEISDHVANMDSHLQ